MKTVGIIGGFGPETTAAFQLAIVELFRAKNCKTRPPILMWNTPIPINIEDELVLHAKKLQNFLPFLIDSARKLENAGADFLVLPCNTLHLHAEEIINNIHIPMLHIVEETAKELRRKKIKNVGILANQTSINNLLLNKNFDCASLQLIKIILNFKKQEVSNILLGCTDLQLILPTVMGVRIHDSMDILARATVREMIGGSL